MFDVLKSAYIDYYISNIFFNFLLYFKYYFKWYTICGKNKIIRKVKKKQIHIVCKYYTFKIKFMDGHGIFVVNYSIKLIIKYRET